jgi:hypothetical protein
MSPGTTYFMEGSACDAPASDVFTAIMPSALVAPRKTP